MFPQAFDKHLRSVVEYAIRVGTPLPDAIFVLSTSADGTTELAAPVPLREWGLLTKVPVLVIGELPLQQMCSAMSRSRKTCTRARARQQACTSADVCAHKYNHSNNRVIVVPLELMK